MRKIEKAAFDRDERLLSDDDLDAVTGGGGFDALIDPGSINGETECTGVGISFLRSFRKI